MPFQQAEQPADLRAVVELAHKLFFAGPLNLIRRIRLQQIHLQDVYKRQGCDIFVYIFLNTVGLQLIGAGVDCFYESIFLLFHPKPNDGWLISCIAISTVYFDYGGWDALYEKEHVL